MPTGFTVSPPSQPGQVGVASAPFTVEAIGGNFNPFGNGQTITISTNNPSDVIAATGGIAVGPFDNPLTWQPGNVASFTFTVTPAALGFEPIGFVNNQNWENPTPVALIFGFSSMLIALVLAIESFLNYLQADSPSVFPLPFNVIRQYIPIKDLTQIASSAGPAGAPPKVYIFPHDDPEDRDGLRGTAFHGEFEVAMIIVANVGLPENNPTFLPLADTMMGMRQSLREALRPETAISLANDASGPAVLQDISTHLDAFWTEALEAGIFWSLQIFKFHLNSVAQ